MGIALGLITLIGTVGGTAWLMHAGKTTAERRIREMEELARTEQERQQIQAQITSIRTQIFAEQMAPIALVGIPVMAGVGFILLHKMKQRESAEDAILERESLD